MTQKTMFPDPLQTICYTHNLLHIVSQNDNKCIGLAMSPGKLKLIDILFYFVRTCFTKMPSFSIVFKLDLDANAQHFKNKFMCP